MPRRNTPAPLAQAQNSRIHCLIGKKFTRLTVIRREPSHGYTTRWLCRCDCGKTTIVYGRHLVHGCTKSCGCWRIECRLKHGMRASAEYQAYCNAKGRCENPNATRYECYGARGIEFQFKDFPQFYKALGRRPKHRSLDRIDVNGNYEPGNVRWATRRQQALNTRRQQVANRRRQS